MKRIVLFIAVLTGCSFFLTVAQNNCDHEGMIVNLLDRISCPDYKPILADFGLFFDSEFEIEYGLRGKFLKDNPDVKLSDDYNSKSFAIEKILTDTIVKYLINQKSIKNCKWKIFKQYKKGSASIIYEVGLDCSPKLIKIQMVNWAYKKRCGICDILDSNDKTIF